MHQLVEYMPTPLTVDVDGHIDRRGIRYIGTAHRQPDGKYIALADVEGCLCRVEVTLSFSETESGTDS